MLLIIVTIVIIVIVVVVKDLLCDNVSGLFVSFLFLFYFVGPRIN